MESQITINTSHDLSEAYVRVKFSTATPSRGATARTNSINSIPASELPPKHTVPIETPPPPPPVSVQHAIIETKQAEKESQSPQDRRQSDDFADSILRRYDVSSVDNSNFATPRSSTISPHNAGSRVTSMNNKPKSREGRLVLDQAQGKDNELVAKVYGYITVHYPKPNVRSNWTSHGHDAHLGLEATWICHLQQKLVVVFAYGCKFIPMSALIILAIEYWIESVHGGRDSAT